MIGVLLLLLAVAAGFLLGSVWEGARNGGTIDQHTAAFTARLRETKAEADLESTREQLAAARLRLAARSTPQVHR